MWKSIINKPVVKILFIAILFLVILFLVLPIIFRRFGVGPSFGKLQKPTTVFTRPVEPSVSFAFTGNTDLFVSFPKTAIVYRFSKPDKKELLNKLLPVLSFLGLPSNPEQKEPSNNNVLAWNNARGRLSLKLDTGQFVFKGRSISVLLGNKNTVDTIKEKLVSWQFLTGNEESNASYLKTSGYEQTVTKNQGEADTIEVTFMPTANSLPLFGTGPAEKLLSVKININSGEIIEIENFIRDIDKTNTATYQLVPITNVIRGLGPTNITVVSLKNSSGVFISDFGKVKSVKLNTTQLSYHLTAENQLFLQPVYVFAGSALLNSGEEGKIVLFVPAVEGQYLSP